MEAGKVIEMFCLFSGERHKIVDVVLIILYNGYMFFLKEKE